MTSPNDLMRQEAQPLGETVTLARETARGFQDRGGRFRIDEEGATLADRWTSAFFNVRGAKQDGGSQTEGAPDNPQRAPDARQDHFTVQTETVQGFVARGGKFVGGGKGAFLGDRLVSDWFNFRTE